MGIINPRTEATLSTEYIITAKIADETRTVGFGERMSLHMCEARFDKLSEAMLAASDIMKHMSDAEHRERLMASYFHGESSEGVIAWISDCILQRTVSFKDSIITIVREVHD